MKWWKHQCDLWDHEGVAALVARKGPAGYGILCRVLDVTARVIERGNDKCCVRYPVTRWSELLSVRGSHVRHWFAEIELTGLVTVEWIGTDIQVTIPMLLEWKDEYTSRSQQTPDDVPRQSKSQSELLDLTKSSDKSNCAAKDELPTDADNHKTLLKVLNLDAKTIPADAQWNVDYMEKAWQMEGKPTERSELANWLDNKVKFFQKNGDKCSKAIFRRMKELQKELREKQ